MELIKAYQVIPMQGNVIRLYEFEGRFQYRVDPATNGGNFFKKNPQAKLRAVGVFAESLYDAVIFLRLVRPYFLPIRVAQKEELKVELSQAQLSPLPQEEES